MMHATNDAGGAGGPKPMRRGFLEFAVRVSDACEWTSESSLLVA